MTFVLFNYSAKNHPILFLDDMTIDHKKGIFVTKDIGSQKVNKEIEQTCSSNSSIVSVLLIHF